MKKRFFLLGFALAFSLLGLVFILLGAHVTANARFLSPFAVPEPQWGRDIQVNPAPSSTPAIHRNHSLAINPINPNMVIAGYESPFSNQGVLSYGWSTDAGHTWGSGTFPGPWGDNLTPIQDPHVAFDANGVGYYSGLVVGTNLSGYFILTTTNGMDWSTPVPITLSDYNESRRQAYMVVDATPGSPYAGSIYMFWFFSNNTYPYYQGIRMRYSRDGGLTWSQDIQVSDPGNEYSFGPFAAVASDGTVYVSWQEVDNNSIFNPPKLYLDRTTDGGDTWGTDQMISGAPITPMGRPDFKGRELTLLGDSNCTLMHINHWPAIAALPGNPAKLIAAWNDGRWEPDASFCGMTGRHGDIAMSRSFDAGATWTAPVRLNDDPIGNNVDQLMPMIATRLDGLIGVTWLDRRYDPAGNLYDLVYTQSDDGGTTWTPNRRVSDASSDPNVGNDYKGLDNIGVRNTLALAPGYALPAWFNASPGSREGNFFVDRGVFATLTPTATPTSTVTPTSTPAAMLIGHVNWQSRPTQPHALQQLPITLTLKLGATEVNYPVQTTDASGFFTVSVRGLAAGIYSWRVKGPKFLANSGSVQLNVGTLERWNVSTNNVPTFQRSNVPTINAEMGTLRAGDCDDNNRINVLDFNILKNTFGKGIGDPNYDDRADFNGDQHVNVLDFSAQKVNFGSGGAPPIGVASKSQP